MSRKLDVVSLTGEEYDKLESDRAELLTMLKVAMNLFGGDLETVMLTIVEDPSTLTQFQELTSAVIAKAEGK